MGGWAAAVHKKRRGTEGCFRNVYAYGWRIGWALYEGAQCFFEFCVRLLAFGLIALNWDVVRKVKGGGVVRWLGEKAEQGKQQSAKQ